MQLDPVSALCTDFSGLGFSDKVAPVKKIRNAHQDDIHGFIKASPHLFVSGSKDNSVKIWDLEGACLGSCNPQNKEKGYKFWVTALCHVNDTSFASGTRNGVISLWKHDGTEERSFTYDPHGGKAVSKERNKKRINCIAVDIFRDQHCIFSGTPCYVQRWDLESGKMRNFWKVHDNDWVYCIEPLSDSSFITVIGSQMDVWTDIYKKSCKGHSIVSENMQGRRDGQREHISSLARSSMNRDHMAYSVFDGSFRVVDITTAQILRDSKEHDGRVWSVIELYPHLFATGADDHAIKLWDLREKKSVITLPDNEGRVSSLLKVKDTQFISGSCPDKVFESEEKAAITFWDISKLKPL